MSDYTFKALLSTEIEEGHEISFRSLPDWHYSATIVTADDVKNGYVLITIPDKQKAQNK